jgi:hypothetical protein
MVLIRAVPEKGGSRLAVGEVEPYACGSGTMGPLGGTPAGGSLDLYGAHSLRARQLKAGGGDGGGVCQLGGG